MATLLDLFKDRKSQLYANDTARVDVSVGGASASEIFIESRGIINIPRKAAQLATGPNTLGGLIGNVVGAALKGSANRPSDTLFGSNKGIARPLSLLGPAQDFRIKDLNTERGGVFVKRDPGPGAVLGSILNGTSSPGNAAKNAALQAINDPGKTIAAAKALFRKRKDEVRGYGPYDIRDVKAKSINKETIKYSDYYPVERQSDISKRGQYNSPEVQKRENWKSWSSAHDKNDAMLWWNEWLRYQTTEDQQKFVRENIDKYDITYVWIRPIDRQQSILLPGTISGLSEDISPEISDYRYLGSPFKLYKYLGVERSLKFNIKLYCLSELDKQSMLNVLHDIRVLAFPNPKLASSKYGNSVSQLSIAPNILQVTVQGMYENLYCMLDSLSYTIDDETPWISDTRDADTIVDSAFSDRKSPAVIDVSFSFKIIENPSILSSDSTWEYESAFGKYFTQRPLYTEPKQNSNKPETKVETNPGEITEEITVDMEPEVVEEIIIDRTAKQIGKQQNKVQNSKPKNTNTKPPPKEEPCIDYNKSSDGKIPDYLKAKPTGKDTTGRVGASAAEMKAKAEAAKKSKAGGGFSEVFANSKLNEQSIYGSAGAPK